MKCPTDGTALVMSERSGIEIDYCPECRGVWLDRGELDKIVDRSLSSDPGSVSQRQSGFPTSQYDDRASKHGSGHGQRDGHDASQRNGRRRGGWLGELFD